MTENQIQVISHCQWENLCTSLKLFCLYSVSRDRKDLTVFITRNMWQVITYNMTEISCLFYIITLYLCHHSVKPVPVADSTRVCELYTDFFVRVWRLGCSHLQVNDSWGAVALHGVELQVSLEVLGIETRDGKAVAKTSLNNKGITELQMILFGPDAKTLQE